MGNKFVIFTALFAAFALLHSCKELGSNDAQIRQMEDTLFKRYPTVNGVTIEVKEHQDVFVTLRDKELYKATEAEQQRITGEVAQLSVQLFEKDNYLKDGTVIFVENETSIENDPAKQKKY